ncbi:MAG: energy transducer TonB [Veillonellaceae bacterium]|nr:energy transducer TonB [Veillonellaceae bacterium]
MTIRLCVDTDGSIMKIDILTEVPSLGFREEVLRVASQWRFAPVTYRGTPVRMNFVKTFTFRP